MRIKLKEKLDILFITATETLILIRNLILKSLVPKIVVNCAMMSWRIRFHSFIHSGQRRSRLQHGYCIGVSRRSAQATAGKGLAQGAYVTARAGVEPTTLRLRVIASTNAPSRPTRSGPITPVARNGFRYTASFVDDYSGTCTVYFLCQKCDVVHATEKFLADCAPIAEVKRLRTDNGTEFTNKDFKSLMLKHRIKHEKSAPYSPHQNGTVERSWRSLFDMARCLLIESKLPKELWTGRKPDLSRMSVFGSKCYAFVQDKRKLDPRSEKGVFIGYDHESPAYLVYLKNSGVVKKSKCVRFTNKFDVIESEVVVNDQFQNHIHQKHTVTESVTRNKPATETVNPPVAEAAERSDEIENENQNETQNIPPHQIQQSVN